MLPFSVSSTAANKSYVRKIKSLGVRMTGILNQAHFFFFKTKKFQVAFSCLFAGCEVRERHDQRCEMWTLGQLILKIPRGKKCPIL